ncbi:testis-expressed protein 9 isoform X1 [Erythrolamprus reginae]|uniref:testis-expressed protein 9 isoform X1 n=1 Tax=Erythrolamprus reginae TaxID=121349 RepID=UPI00396CB29E
MAAAAAGEQPARPRSAAPLLAREEEYRRLNAALEAKAAAVMRQAEELMGDRRARGDALEEEEEAAAKERDVPSPEAAAAPLAPPKLPKKRASPAPAVRSRPLTARRGRRPLSSTKSRLQVEVSNTDVAAAPGGSLTKLIGRIEGQLEEGNLPDLEDNIIPSAGCELGAEAQIRFLKAKLRVMQEELDAIGQECSKKDGENENFSSRLKVVEEECARLQRTASLHQAQAEKYKVLSEEAARKSEGLQQKLSMLDKVTKARGPLHLPPQDTGGAAQTGPSRFTMIGQSSSKDTYKMSGFVLTCFSFEGPRMKQELENLKRAQKQAAATQSTTDIRLNRALEEAEKYKMELNKLKQSNKDVVNQEHKKLEELKIENRRLEKQKEELVAGFKKQLKLIDILKRQKMHIESAKMLSFTEEEFMKALEWGNP